MNIVRATEEEMRAAIDALVDALARVNVENDLAAKILEEVIKEVILVSWKEYNIGPGESLNTKNRSYC